MRTRRRLLTLISALLVAGGATSGHAQLFGQGAGYLEEPTEEVLENPELGATMASDAGRRLVAAWVPGHVDPEVLPVEGWPGVHDVSFDVPGVRGDGLAMLAELGEACRDQGDTGPLADDALLRALRSASTLARSEFPDEPLNVHVRLDTGYDPASPDEIGEARVMNWDVFLGRRSQGVLFERTHTGRLHTTPELAQAVTAGMWDELSLGRMSGGTVHPPVFLPAIQGPGGSRGAISIRYTTRVQQGPESVYGDFTFGLWPSKPDPAGRELRIGVGVQGRAKPKSSRGLLKGTALEVASETVLDEVPRSFRKIWAQLESFDKLVITREEPLRLYTRKAWHEEYRKPDPSRKYGRSRQREQDRAPRHERGGPNIFTTEVVNSGRVTSGGALWIDLRRTQEKLIGAPAAGGGMLAPVNDDFWITPGSVGFGFVWTPVGGEGASE